MKKINALQPSLGPNSLALFFALSFQVVTMSDLHDNRQRRMRSLNRDNETLVREDGEWFRRSIAVGGEIRAVYEEWVLKATEAVDNGDESVDGQVQFLWEMVADAMESSKLDNCR